HPVLQQYGSAAQMLPTQLSQLAVSFAPVLQSECAQVALVWQAWLTQLWLEPQLAHTEPPAPQALFAVPVTQLPLASTQPLQGLVTQAPLVQLWLEPQATQAAPPVPQALAVLPAAQAPLASTQPMQLIVPIAIATGAEGTPLA